MVGRMKMRRIYLIVACIYVGIKREWWIGRGNCSVPIYRVHYCYVLHFTPFFLSSVHRQGKRGNHLIKLLQYPHHGNQLVKREAQQIIVADSAI